MTTGSTAESGKVASSITTAATGTINAQSICRILYIYFFQSDGEGGKDKKRKLETSRDVIMETKLNVIEQCQIFLP